MIDIPSNLINGNSVYFGDKRFVYNDGKLVPYIVSNVGTELPSPKLGIEVLTTKRHSVSGKPLYVKTIDCGFLPATKTYKMIPLNITDDYDYVKILTDDSHIVIPNVKDFSFSVLMPWYTLESQIGAYTESNSIIIGVGMGQSNKKAYITVEYTKTSDTSSSPIKSLYTGSLNELKLNQETHAGYRRNGKDVYQIELDFGAMPNNTSKNMAIPNYNAAYDYYVRVDLTQVTNGPNNKIYGTYSYGGINYLISVKMSNINAISNFDASAYNAKVVLHYTK